jgi:hypothetical protein
MMGLHTGINLHPKTESATFQTAEGPTDYLAWLKQVRNFTENSSTIREKFHQNL